jgi:S1-C subfamily serine protease
MLSFLENVKRPPRSRLRGLMGGLLLLLLLSGSLWAEITAVRVRDSSFWRPPFGFRPMSPHPAVVRVLVPERGTTANGSGALVGSYERYGLVVTNWHVVRDAAGEISVVFPDGFRSAARVLRVDEEWDLAALMIWRPQTQPIPIATVAPRPGDVLSIAGYGRGDYRAATGQCIQYVAPGNNRPYEMVEVSAQARQGDSGGPIFNERGELAGVLFGSSHGTTSGSYCGRVQRFVDTVWPPEFNAEATRVAVSPSETDTGWTARPDQEANSEQRDAQPAEVVAANFDLTPPRENADWSRWTGVTPFEQSKTFFAGIGLLTVLFQFSKFFLAGKNNQS